MTGAHAIATEPGRILPHNAEAEQAILGIVLLEGAGVLPKIASALQVSDFFVDAHQQIFETMLAMGAAGLPVSIITLSERLRQEERLHAVGGPAALAFLEERATIEAHLSTYLDIVRAHGIRRELIVEAEQRMAEAYEARTPAANLLEAHRLQLDKLAQRTAAGEIIFPVRTLAELRQAQLEQPEYHLEGWIQTKGVAFVVGDSGAFKSWFVKYFGLCKAAGVPLFDKIPVRQGPVLYVSEENGVVEDRRRVDLLCRAFNFPDGIPFYIASETSFRFDDPARYAALRAFIVEHRITQAIFDSFVRVHRLQEKDAGEMNALYMDRMKPLIQSGCDLLLLHHRRKLPAGLQAAAAQGGSDNDEIRGSGDLRAAAHSVIFLRPQSKSHVVVRHNKSRGARTQDPFVFSLTDQDSGGIRLAWEGKPEDHLDKTEACKLAVLEYASERPAGFFQQDIYTALKPKGFSKRVIKPVLTALAKDGYPLKEDEFQQGRTKKKLYVLVSAEPEPGENGDNADVPF